MPPATKQELNARGSGRRAMKQKAKRQREQGLPITPTLIRGKARRKLHQGLSEVERDRLFFDGRDRQFRIEQAREAEERRVAAGTQNSAQEEVHIEQIPAAAEAGAARESTLMRENELNLRAPEPSAPRVVTEDTTVTATDVQTETEAPSTCDYYFQVTIGLLLVCWTWVHALMWTEPEPEPELEPEPQPEYTPDLEEEQPSADAEAQTALVVFEQATDAQTLMEASCLRHLTACYSMVTNNYCFRVARHYLFACFKKVIWVCTLLAYEPVFYAIIPQVLTDLMRVFIPAVPWNSIAVRLVYTGIIAAWTANVCTTAALRVCSRRYLGHYTKALLRSWLAYNELFAVISISLSLPNSFHGSQFQAQFLADSFNADAAIPKRFNHGVTPSEIIRFVDPEDHKLRDSSAVCDSYNFSNVYDDPERPSPVPKVTMKLRDIGNDLTNTPKWIYASDSMRLESVFADSDAPCPPAREADIGSGKQGSVFTIGIQVNETTTRVAACKEVRCANLRCTVNADSIRCSPMAHEILMMAILSHDAEVTGSPHYLKFEGAWSCKRPSIFHNNHNDVYLAMELMRPNYNLATAKSAFNAIQKAAKRAGIDVPSEIELQENAGRQILVLLHDAQFKYRLGHNDCHLKNFGIVVLPDSFRGKNVIYNGSLTSLDDPHDTISFVVPYLGFVLKLIDFSHATMVVSKRTIATRAPSGLNFETNVESLPKLLRIFSEDSAKGKLDNILCYDNLLQDWLNNTKPRLAYIGGMVLSVRKFVEAYCHRASKRWHPGFDFGMIMQNLQADPYFYATPFVQRYQALVEARASPDSSMADFEVVDPRYKHVFGYLGEVHTKLAPNLRKAHLTPWNMLKTLANVSSLRNLTIESLNVTITSASAISSLFQNLYCVVGSCDAAPHDDTTNRQNLAPNLSDYGLVESESHIMKENKMLARTNLRSKIATGGETVSGVFDGTIEQCDLLTTLKQQGGEMLWNLSGTLHQVQLGLQASTSSTCTNKKHIANWKRPLLHCGDARVMMALLFDDLRSHLHVSPHGVLVCKGTAHLVVSTTDYAFIDFHRLTSFHPFAPMLPESPSLWMEIDDMFWPLKHIAYKSGLLVNLPPARKHAEPSLGRWATYKNQMSLVQDNAILQVILGNAELEDHCTVFNGDHHNYRLVDTAARKTDTDKFFTYNVGGKVYNLPNMGFQVVINDISSAIVDHGAAVFAELPFESWSALFLPEMVPDDIFDWVRFSPDQIRMKTHIQTCLVRITTK
jgi:hypothetical protein